LVLTGISFSQNFDKMPGDEKLKKAKAVISKSIEKLGGEKYLNVKSSIGEGKFSLLKDGINVSFQSFVDVIVLPDTERTDFIERGSKIVRVNSGNTGWIFEEYVESLRDQKEKDIKEFKIGLRASYDYLLRGDWVNEAKLTYTGRRRASLGKRNDVLKLTFNDGYEVEYEFSDKGMPMKTVFYKFDSDKKRIVEENRYAQFLLEQGIQTPFIIDRYTDNVHVFRINYESIRYNERIPKEIFVKPGDSKKLRKKLKL
jgi:hypothetical protein